MRRKDERNPHSPKNDTRRISDAEAGLPSNIDLEIATSLVPPNYNTNLIWILIQLIACIFLFLLWAPNPSQATGIIAAGTDYIGAFRKCSGPKCEDWLKMDGSTAGSSAKEVDQTSVKSAETDKTATNLVKRAGSVSDGLDNFFLNTGMAILSAFYFSLYITIFLMIRYRTLQPLGNAGPDENGKDGQVIKGRVRGKKRRGLKLFAYRASRSLGVVNVVLIFGSICACGKAVWDIRTKMELKGSDGVGGGLILLLFALFFSLYSCIRDLASPEGKIQRWIGFRWIFCCFPKKAARARESGIEMTPSSPKSPERKGRPRRHGGF